MTSHTCPSSNTQAVAQANFWSPNGIDWDAHRIGWAIAGGCAVLTVIISSISVLLHCRNYTKPREQRQIIRILYMPPVYAVISFFSYRYFRSYTYFSLIYVVYEAVTLSAFLLLLVEYVADTATEHSAEKALMRKDKKRLLLPLCCWRYRPTKPYFMYSVKWAVLQYVIFRPAISLAGIICQAYDVLCTSSSFSPYFANAYLQSIDFVSISIALYGLLLFYALTKDELQGRRPLAKFLSIKLIVIFTFYQDFVFNALEGRVIHGTTYWTATNIADGLNALAICIEMVFFSAFMFWAFRPSDYYVEGKRATSIWRPLWDSINYSDFALEIWTSLRYFLGFRKPLTKNESDELPPMDFGQAFGVSSSSSRSYKVPLHSPTSGAPGNDENIRLAPYTGSQAGSPVYSSEGASV